MKQKLIKLINTYASKSEWVGYFAGMEPFDPTVKLAVSERDIAEAELFLFIEGIEIKED